MLALNDNIPFVSIDGEKYGAVFDINAIEKFQSLYGTLKKWSVAIFGDDALAEESAEEIRNQLLILCSYIDNEGRFEKYFEREVKKRLNILTDKYCIPVKYICRDDKLIIENYQYLLDWYNGKRTPTRAKHIVKTKDILFSFSFLVNEYVDIYNAKRSNLNKKGLSEWQLGQLNLEVIRNAIVEAINVSFPSVSTNTEYEDDRPVDIASIYVFSMGKLGFSREETGWLTLKSFNELCLKYKKLLE